MAAMVYNSMHNNNFVLSCMTMLWRELMNASSYSKCNSQDAASAKVRALLRLQQKQL